MASKATKLAAWTTAMLAIVLGLMALTFNLMPGSRAEARQELRSALALVALGDSRRGVTSKINGAGFKRLTLTDRGDQPEWVITTPGEWGAANWLLWIQFCHDGATWMGIRLADGKQFQPPDAPPDKGRADSCRYDARDTPTTP
jgi:hypothetical protein